MKIFRLLSSMLILSAMPIASSSHAQQRTPQLIAEEFRTALSESQGVLLDTLQNNVESMALLNLYAANNLEINLANLALKKSKNTEIHHYAKMLIEDHTRANARVFSLARDENVSLLSAGGASTALLMGGMAQILAKLAMLSDKDFDKAYLNTNIVLHIQTIAQMAGSRMLLVGNLVGNLIDTVMPKLFAHLARAKELREKLD